MVRTQSTARLRLPVTRVAMRRLHELSKCTNKCKEHFLSCPRLRWLPSTTNRQLHSTLDAPPRNYTTGPQAPLHVGKPLGGWHRGWGACYLAYFAQARASSTTQETPGRHQRGDHAGPPAQSAHAAPWPTPHLSQPAQRLQRMVDGGGGNHPVEAASTALRRRRSRRARRHRTTASRGRSTSHTAARPHP